MARTLVTADTIFGGDPPRPGPTAMLIEGDRTTWLGAADAVPVPAPSSTVDLGDATVIPGLIDSHQHMLSWLWLANWIAGKQAVGMATRLEGASNEKAKRELDWQPKYPSWRQGFREALG